MHRTMQSMQTLSIECEKKQDVSTLSPQQLTTIVHICANGSMALLRHLVFKLRVSW